MKNPKAIIVILNWNLPVDTLECAESCRKQDYDNFEVMIVDNGSADDSVQQFRSRFTDVEVIANPENLGYAGGNNVGMRQALAKGADFILLLNNDITLEPDCLRILIETALAHPEAGMLAPKVLYYDDRTVINSLGTSMDWLRVRPYLGEYNQVDRGQFQSLLKKDILMGCGILIPRTTIDRIGLIDDKFFIFHEEADWCLRNLRSGSQNMVVPKAVIYHKESKTMRKFSALTHYYSTRNFLYFTKRNASFINWLKTRVGFTYLTLKNGLRMLVPTGSDNKKMERAYFLGIWDYMRGKMGKCQRSF
ncbi:MAG: glycosyltransferase family 2 protein [Candidatus Omnitrophica bacterium]|nr:glycosyltransferase family 2 protein [Candidatus Omnitrophota bacterium]